MAVNHLYGVPDEIREITGFLFPHDLLLRPVKPRAVGIDHLKNFRYIPTRDTRSCSPLFSPRRIESKLFSIDDSDEKVEKTGALSIFCRRRWDETAKNRHKFIPRWKKTSFFSSLFFHRWWLPARTISDARRATISWAWTWKMLFWMEKKESDLFFRFSHLNHHDFFFETFNYHFFVRNFSRLNLFSRVENVFIKSHLLPVGCWRCNLITRIRAAFHSTSNLRLTELNQNFAKRGDSHASVSVAKTSRRKQIQVVSRGIK